ncbi:hypothetical protein J6590_008148, partial [Homalodisca vitripennis]
IQKTIRMDWTINRKRFSKHDNVSTPSEENIASYCRVVGKQRLLNGNYQTLWGLTPEAVG